MVLGKMGNGGVGGGWGKGTQQNIVGSFFAFFDDSAATATSSGRTVKVCPVLKILDFLLRLLVGNIYGHLSSPLHPIPELVMDRKSGWQSIGLQRVGRNC